MVLQSKIAKIDAKFNQDIKDILKKRIASGKDDPLKPKSIRKITSAITKHKYWDIVKLDIINHTFLEDQDKKMGKRGQIGDLFLFMAVAVIVAIFFGMLIYSFGSVTNVLTSITTNVTGTTNITIGQVASSTLGQVNTALGTLRILSFVLIIGMIFNILLGNFLVQKHPAFIMLYLLITIIAVVVSAYISNFYEGMLVDPLLGSTLQSFTGTNYILMNLPFIVTIVGLFGVIFLTIGIIKRPDLEPQTGVLP